MWQSLSHCPAIGQVAQKSAAHVKKPEAMPAAQLSRTLSHADGGGGALQ